MEKNKKQNFFKKKEEESGLRINSQIRVPQVKLVGDNITMGVYPTNEALRMANDMELDLVEVSPLQTPPVCKIMDYQKFLYDKKKTEKKQTKVETKEIRFTPNIGDHDLSFKIKNAIKFLEDGDRVKALVVFKGRQNAFKSQGAEVLTKFLNALAEVGTADAPLKIEGNKMMLFLKPKKK